MPRKRIHPWHCAGCDTIKSENDFLIRGDGRRRSECNSCRSIDSKERWNNGGKQKKQAYFKTDKGKEVIQKVKQNQMQKDPLFFAKKAARAKVQNEIRSGRISKASVHKCFDCESMAQEYDHYLGYSKEHWLDIQPVCWFCHSRRTHGKEIKI